MSEFVRIMEVGPRDGLQNETVLLDLDTREEFIGRLVKNGLRSIEFGAFVSPKWVPQMAGSGELFDRIAKNHSGLTDVRWSALVPNQSGFDRALKHRIPGIALFASSTESFSLKNLNCSVDESFSRYRAMASRAKTLGIGVRGYLSMCFGCAFEGEVPEKQVIQRAEELFAIGCDEVSIGDTVGIADPYQVRKLIRALVNSVPVAKLAMHFHDTRGTALANVLASLDEGIRVFDSSLGGLGGCPYAPSATGNVATEEIVYILDRMGMKTGIQLDGLIETNHWMAGKIGRELPSRVGKVGVLRPRGRVSQSASGN